MIKAPIPTENSKSKVTSNAIKNSDYTTIVYGLTCRWSV